jgi:hypothetical protein
MSARHRDDRRRRAARSPGASRCRSVAALLIGAVSIAASACSSGSAGATTAAAADPAAAAGDAENVRLVGYNDMQGRYALQVTTKSDPANGNWVYVGNVANPGLSEGLFNPITNQHEWNGTSILEISDPAHPRYVWHIPNQVNDASRSVSVVYDIGPDKHDYLVRSVEARDRLTFQVFDITSRDSDLSKIALMSEISGTDPYHLTEVGHFIPKTNVPDARRPIELTDVDIDHRGFVYASDRSGPSCMAADGSAVTVAGGTSCVGTGLFVLHYTGARAGATTN